MDTDPTFDDEPTALLGAGKTEELTREERRRHRRRTRRRSATVVRDGHSGIEMVYEPNVNVIPPMREYFASLWERREFMGELARSKIRGARSSTALGSIWAILDPLFMTAIYFMVFTVIRAGARPDSFILILIAGIMAFQITSGALGEGANSIRSGRQLMLNSTFPRALLPLSSVYGAVLKFLPAIPVIAVAGLLTGSPLTWNLLFLPLIFTVQILTSCGLALLFATLVVYFQDARNFIQYVSRLLFFTTPIIFPWDFFDGVALDILTWQPLFGLFANYQIVLRGDMPNWWMLSIASGWALAMAVGGTIIFVRHEREFASRI